MKNLLLFLALFLCAPLQGMASSVELRFSPAVLMCYRNEGNTMPCQWAVASEDDRLIIPMEKILEVNGLEVWQGKWQVTLMAEGIYFTYSIDVVKQVPKGTDQASYELVFGIRNSTGKNPLSVKVETDRIENLGIVRLRGGEIVDDHIERFPELVYGAPASPAP